MGASRDMRDGFWAVLLWPLWAWRRPAGESRALGEHEEGESSLNTVSLMWHTIVDGIRRLTGSHRSSREAVWQAFWYRRFESGL